MAVDAPIKRDQKTRLLNQACQRNTPAELHFQRGEADLITARVRLLGLDAELIYVDRPQVVGSQFRLRPRQSAMVYFLLAGTRYAFHSRVVKPRCLVRLNARQRVFGAALAIPAEVRPQQRRADFRLSLAGYDWTVALCHQGEREHPRRCAIDAHRFKVRLVNISAGGVEALVDPSAIRGCGQGDVFFMTFFLPEVEQEFCMRTELRHTRHIHNGRSTLAGFMFLPWEMAPLKPYVRQINRFIATEQRRQLRRGR